MLRHETRGQERTKTAIHVRDCLFPALVAASAHGKLHPIEGMKKRYHVAVVGGGVIGCAIACFLTAANPQRRVCVLERDPTYRQASSALSASSIRQQFSTPISVHMSQFGFSYLKGIAADVGLIQRGYLIVTGAGGASAMREDQAMQQANGATVELLDPAALSRRFTWLNSEDVSLASYGARGEGWFDGFSLLQWFRSRAKSNGTDFRTAEVVAFATSGARIDSAITDDNLTVAADVFVNACGPWAAKLCEQLNLELPVSARKRQVFVFDCKAPPANLPMIFDPSGVWCRPEGGRYITGRAPQATNDPPDAPLDQIDYRAFDEAIWPILAHRVPAFESIKLTSAWAGYYALNTFDQNAIVGAHPQMENLLLANGFSGHGMQHAPAVARGIAELIEYGEYRSLDLSPLSFARVQAGKPIVERTVY